MKIVNDHINTTRFGKDSKVQPSWFKPAFVFCRFGEDVCEGRLSHICLVLLLLRQLLLAIDRGRIWARWTLGLIQSVCPSFPKIAS